MDFDIERFCADITEWVEREYNIGETEKVALYEFLTLSFRFLVQQGSDELSVENIILLLRTLIDCGYDYRVEETAFDIIMEEAASSAGELRQLYERFRLHKKYMAFDAEEKLRKALGDIYLSGT